MTLRKQLFNTAEVKAGIKRLAAAIHQEFHGQFGNVAVVGIHYQGVPLAKYIVNELRIMGEPSPQEGKLDITMYRDDINSRKILPMIRETIMPFDVNNRVIILVDDVLSSGRTIRAALDAITDYGRPALIRLAVLADRGNPEFPIRADYVGMRIAVPQEHKVAVRFEPDEMFQPGIYEIEWK